VLAARKAAYTGNFTAVKWLLEDGGADIADVADDGGNTIWEIVAHRLNHRLLRIRHLPYRFDPADQTDAEGTALLRVVVLKGDPPADFVARLENQEHARVVEEGARLRAALPANLARRRAFLDAHCPLIALLLALVRDYDPEPTTTEELWATGLGAAPEQRAWRPRPEVAVALPVRRSAHLRQRLE
jgi:hypothetical protein